MRMAAYKQTLNQEVLEKSARSRTKTGPTSLISDSCISYYSLVLQQQPKPHLFEIPATRKSKCFTINQLIQAISAITFN